MGPFGVKIELNRSDSSTLPSGHNTTTMERIFPMKAPAKGDANQVNLRGVNCNIFRFI